MSNVHSRFHNVTSNPSGTKIHTRGYGKTSTPSASKIHTRVPVNDVFLPYQLPTSSSGIAKMALPDAATFDPGSAAGVQAVHDQATLSGTWQYGAWAAPFLNVSAWSGLYYVVGNDQPLVRVKVNNAQTALEFAIGDSGVPIPSTAVPQAEFGDTDSSAFIYQPNDVRATGGPSYEGTYYEFWGLNRAHGADLAAGYTFTCYQMCRMVGANAQGGRMFDLFWQVGASYDNPGSDPYATVFPDGRINQTRGIMQYGYWGSFAIGANPPGATLMVHPADILRPTADGKTGICDHVIGLEVADCRSGALWPAQRGDGTYGAEYPFCEGNWFRFPYNATMPNNLTPFGELLWRTIQKYGMIACDKTATCIAMRAAPSCGALLLGPGSSHDGRDWSAWAFTNFPWLDLQMLKVGSDSTFHPIT